MMHEFVEKFLATAERHRGSGYRRRPIGTHCAAGSSTWYMRLRLAEPRERTGLAGALGPPDEADRCYPERITEIQTWENNGWTNPKVPAP